MIYLLKSIFNLLQAAEYKKRSNKFRVKSDFWMNKNGRAGSAVRKAIGSPTRYLPKQNLPS